MEQNKKDYYKILKIKKEASQAEIKNAFRKLAKEYHPDINSLASAEEKFKEVNEAYEVLKDENKRAAYDKYCADKKLKNNSQNNNANQFTNNVKSSPQTKQNIFFSNRPTGKGRTGAIFNIIWSILAIIFVLLNFLFSLFLPSLIFIYILFLVFVIFQFWNIITNIYFLKGEKNGQTVMLSGIFSLSIVGTIFIYLYKKENSSIS